MRKWINLFEDNSVDLVETVSRFPAVIDTDSLLNLLLDLHHTPEDFSDGDLSKRLYRFRQYELVELPLSDINPEEWYHDEDMSLEYSRREIGDDFPPIVYDAVKKSIIDGTHRTHAAIMSGQKTIRAYVGTKLARNTGADKIHPAVMMRSSRHNGQHWETNTVLNRPVAWKKDW